MSKFKVGDKVRILDGSNIENYTGKWCAAGMEEYVGKTHTVENMWPEDDRTAYSLSGIPFKWDERGLELVEDEPKFKVGDKVIGNANADVHYGITRQGWTGVVTGTDYSGKYIDVCGRGDAAKSVVFHDLRADCFNLDKAASTQKIVITTDGKKTIAKLYDGKTVIKTAQASCAPSDDFDFKFGASLALDRLTGFVRGAVECALDEKSDELLNCRIYIIDGGDSTTFETGKTYEIKNGHFTGEADHMPYDGDLRNLNDLVYYLASDSMRDKLPHSKNLSMHCINGVVYKVIPALDWNKFAHGELEVKVNKENFGEFMKQCEVKNFHWPDYAFATSFNPYEVYEKAKGAMKFIIDMIGVIPMENIWVAFDADDDCLRWGPVHNKDVDEYEFV